MRGLVRSLLLVLALGSVRGDAHAQKKCKRGTPCGNSCIAANKTRRIGTPSASSNADTIPFRLGSVASASTGTWIASRRGKTHYKAGCSGANKLSSTNVIRSKSEEEAQKAGYHRSAMKGC